MSQRIGLVVLVSVALSLVLLTRVAWADAVDAGATPVDPTTEANALYAQAEADDAALRFAEAADHYEASVAKAPSHRHAPRARARAEVLRRHAEGGFAAFIRLERVRRDPHLASDPAALAALVEDARTFPPGPTRVEARMLVAEAYLGRLARPADAVPLLRQVVDDPEADPLSERQSRRELVDVLERLGDHAGAARTAKTEGADPQLAHEVRVQTRRRYLHTASIVTLLAFAAAAALAIALRARQSRKAVLAALSKFTTVTIAFALWSGVLGGLLASTYETGNAKPFLLFGAGLVPLLLLARAWAACSSSARWTRVARGGLSATSVLAAGFLVLESVDVTYLEGFGL